MTDPITDMLNRIRNAQVVLKSKVSIPFSNKKLEIAKILMQEDFVNEIKKSKKKNNKTIEIILKYNEGIPAISGLKRISKPGQRIYAKVSEIKSVRNGYGIAIISTSKGLMTNKKARKEKLGGEVILLIIK